MKTLFLRLKIIIKLAHFMIFRGTRGDSYYYEHHSVV